MDIIIIILVEIRTKTFVKEKVSITTISAILTITKKIKRIQLVTRKKIP